MKIIIISCILSILYTYIKAEGYEYYSDYDISYKFHSEPKTWIKALLTCIEENATLAMPKCENEAMILSQIFDAYRSKNTTKNSADKDYIHIGFHGLFNEHEYVTLQDESLEEVYHRWAKNRPQNIDKELCGAMHCSGNLSNICCHRLKGFICQKRDTNLESKILRNCHGSDRGYKDAYNLSKSYKLHMSPRTWTDARAICHAEGGHLAIIRNNLEKTFVQDMLSDAEYHTPMTDGEYFHAFIGIHDIFKEGNFTTVLGEHINTTHIHWEKDEPGGGKIENCLGIKTTGGLRDYICMNKAVFICERQIHLN